MNRPTNQSEIMRGIIKFIPVNMMNNFTSGKRSAQDSNHYIPMFQNSFPIDGYDSVSLRRNATFSISPFFTEVGVTIADKSQIMSVTKAMSLNWRFAADRTLVRSKVLDEFASFGVFQQTVHVPSFSTILPQIQTVVKRDGGKNGVNSGEALTDGAEGNPEPSRGYTPGRCNDYWRGRVPLITSLNAPPERDEIVYSSWKHEVEKYDTDCDGVGMEKPAAKGATGLGRAAVAGVAAETIAASAYGLVQVYGYHSAVRVISATTGSGAIAKGTALVGAKTAWYALENAGKTGTQANAYCKGFALAAQASYTTKAIAAFILCL